MTLRARWVALRARLVDAKSSLGDAEISLGGAESSLGDATSSLGGTKSSLGDAKSSLGDAKSSLGGTKSSLGDVQVAAESHLSPSRAQLLVAGAMGAGMAAELVVFPGTDFLFGIQGLFITVRAWARQSSALSVSSTSTFPRLVSAGTLTHTPGWLISG